MIEIFVNNFIKPQHRERLLYELKSIKTNKREKAFIKLLDYNEYFLETLSKIDLSHKTDQEIIRILKTDVKLDNGYSLKWQTNKDLIKTVINAINSYSLDIILVDENMIIYLGEVYHNNDGSNASAKFLFYKL
jgi:2-hydroxy-3-keto-5-methylthiopentenyl-1-phosphate phosphatase